MRLDKKILATWFVIFLLLRVAMEFPHTGLEWVGFVNIFIQTLLALVAYHIFRLSRGSQKLVWLNFTVLFGIAPLLALSSFVGISILPGDLKAQLFTHLYITKILLPLITLLAVFYAGADYYFRTSGTVRKYLFAAVMAIITLSPFLGSYAIDPKNIYLEPDFKDFNVIKRAAGTLVKEGIDPSPEAITGRLTAGGWDGRTAESIRERVNTLSHYLVDGNQTALFWRPVEIGVAGTHMVGAGVLLFSVYSSARPHHAYLDKILLAFGVAEILEILHHIKFAYSDSLAGYNSIFQAGQYFSIFLYAGLAIVLSLKLRFLAGGAGRYYELAIATHPNETTRLIDDIDRLILTSFFPGGKRGTLAQRQPKEKAEGRS